MALNKLKKWIGTQAMTAFFDQLNDNVNATNAAIDLAETNSATVASLLAGGTKYTATLQSGWSGYMSYSVNDLDQLVIAGAVIAGTVGMGTQIFILPEGYRPAQHTPISAYNFTTALNLPAQFLANTVGGVLIRNVSGLTAGDSIRFNVVIPL